MLTNINNIALSIAVWLADDDYDHNPAKNYISATGLLKSTKSILLGSVGKEETNIDISELVSSSMGTALHTAIESAWLKPNLKDTLTKLGYPKSLIKNIVINPTTVEDDQIPIYMEIRKEKEINGYTISGKFDFIADGVLEDFKSTGTYTWINQTNAEKYVQQGSIYRWLNPEIITSDVMRIQYIFTDWSAAKARQDSSYPQSRIVQQEYFLMSIEATENFIATKLREIDKYKESSQDLMPACTDEEVWANPPTYKYYKNPLNKTRSTKNFDNYWEAHKRYIDDGSIGEVVTVKGSVGFCRYCPAVNVCNQAQSYVAEGLLIL